MQIESQAEKKDWFQVAVSRIFLTFAEVVAFWSGIYTLKGTDGKTYKFVLKSGGTAVLYVNGKETDYGSWKWYNMLCFCRVSFDDTVVAIPGQPNVDTFYLKYGEGDVLYAYAFGAEESENPKKRVKCTQIK